MKNFDGFFPQSGKRVGNVFVELASALATAEHEYAERRSGDTLFGAVRKGAVQGPAKGYADAKAFRSARQAAPGGLEADEDRTGEACREFVDAARDGVGFNEEERSAREFGGEVHMTMTTVQ